MKKTALILMILTIFSKVLGFSREITLSYFFGASNISDAYIISLTIPVVIFSFIGIGITTGYIPMYSKIVNDFGEGEGNRYTNNLVNILFVICTILIILGLVFINDIVKIFASGFKGETLALAIKFTKISLFGIYFTGLISVFNGFLQIKGNYFIPALIGFPLNFIIILSIFISNNTNIMVLIIGNVAAVASQLLLVIPFIHKKGYRYKFIFDIRNEYIKKMAFIAGPLIIGVTVNQINVLVDRTMASGIAIGGISALNYANLINEFVQGLFVMPIVTVMYPLISKMVVDNNISLLKRSLTDAIFSINLFVMPATIGVMVFSEPLVKLLFGRGAFDSMSVQMTSDALFFYSIGMLGIGLREVLCRAFYSMQNTKTPMFNAAISLTINILLNIILSKFLGIGGLALATSISAVFGTGLLFISLRRKIGAFGTNSIYISFVKVLCASLIIGVVSKLTYNFILGKISNNLSLITSIGIGLVLYFIIIYFMRIKEVEPVVSELKRIYRVFKEFGFSKCLKGDK